VPVTAVLESDRVISRPRHHVWSAGRHHLVTPGAAVVLLRRGTRHLPDEPIAIGMTFSALPTQGVQRSVVIAIIVDAAILATHG